MFRNVLIFIKIMSHFGRILSLFILNALKCRLIIGELAVKRESYEP